MRNKIDFVKSAAVSRKHFYRALRHSYYIKILKLILPFVAILIIVLFSWISVVSLPSVPKIITMTGSEKLDNKLVMTSPKIEGYTSDNRKYALTAERAVQDPKKTGMIELENIRASLPMGETGQAILDAKKGIFDNINGRMQFLEPFTVYSQDGMSAHFLSANINVATSQLKTNDRVEIRTKTDFLQADGMHVLDNGHRILFEGNVRLVIGQSTTP